MSSSGHLVQLVDGVLDCPGRANEIPSYDPSTEGLLALAPEADAGVVAKAVSAARRAFDDGSWSMLPVQARASKLQLVADLLEENLEAFAQAESADTGMTLKMTSLGHLPRAIAHLRFFAEEAVRMSGECIPMDGAYFHLVQREPLGVIAVLAPWNAPLAVATMNVAAALAVGNTVVLKSSERAPVTLALLAKLLAAADFPPGVINVIHGRGQPTGEALALAVGVDGLCFVGGTETAKTISRWAPIHRRNIFELGGKSPTIVLADADLDTAIDGALLSAFSSNGEVCTAGSRILVHESLQHEFLNRLAERARAIRVGDPRDPHTEMGPLIDGEHLQHVLASVERAVGEGATLVCGGHRPASLPLGHYMTPVVLADVQTGMEIAQEEVFGPVAAVFSFRDDEEAIALANDTNYGLSATVWSADSSRGLALARHLRCGVVGVNAPVIRDIRAPFGGRRESGIGRVGGRWSLEQYTEIKTINVRVSGMPLPRMGTGNAL